MAWYNFWKNTKKTPARRAYSAAQVNRLVADFMASNTSADAEIRTSLVKLRDRSRQLERDNDYIRGFLRAIENNVVGEGIPFQAQVKMQRGKDKLDERMNDAIEAKWKAWTRDESCHTGGAFSFEDIERIAIRSIARDGEIFIRVVNRPFGSSKIPMALEVIEADQLDENKNGIADGTGNQIRMGVEVDKWQRPVAYWFLEKHPGDYQFTAGYANRSKHIRVPADEVIHLFVQERVGQSRGVPWLVSAMLKLHHLEGYTQSEVIAARAGAALMGFIETPEGELIGDDIDQGQRVTEFEPGVFKQLNPGERVNVPKLERPGGQFGTFTGAILQSVASGLGISYESISKNYAGASYSSARQALLEDRDNYRAIQKWMIRKFHQKVFEMWIFRASLAGELQLPLYEIAPERYHAVKWMPRGWTWIDPLKEVNAYKEAVKAGFATQTSVLAQSGEDFEEVMIQRAREVARAEELGLIFDTDASLDVPPPATPDDEESPDDTEDQ